MGHDESLEPTKAKGWNIGDATSYKKNEMKKAKESWEQKITADSNILDILSELDSIVRINDKNLRFQISGYNYDKKTHQDFGVSELTIRITDNIEHIREIENNFFQNIQEDGRTRLKNSKVVFEVESAYDESVEILCGRFSNIRLEIPTMKSFYQTRISENNN